MPKINVRKKGANNENALCKALGAWTGSEFTRVPASGGLQWKERMDVCGDVIDVSRIGFPFVVETKSWLKMPAKLNNASVLSAIQQAEREAIPLNKKPLVFVRLNGMKPNTWLVITNYELKLTIFKQTANIFCYLSTELFATNYADFIL